MIHRLYQQYQMMFVEAFSNSISPMDAAVIKDALKVKGVAYRQETVENCQHHG